MLFRSQSRKGEFALELADELLVAAETTTSDLTLYRAQRGYAPPVAPAHLVAVLNFLYPPPPPEPTTESDAVDAPPTPGTPTDTADASTDASN